MDPQKKKTPKSAYNNDNLIEQLRDMGRGVAKTVKTDLVGGMAQDALSSLFGTPKSAPMTPGESVRIPQTDIPPESPFWPERPQPALWGRREQYHSQFSQEVINNLKSQEAEVMHKIEEIRQELKALVATLKVVNREIVQAVEGQMVDPGLYHLSFLDRIKTVLKLINQNLHESRSWLNVMHSRRKQRKYWNQYKKKGTEWGLNPERVLATQVG